MAVYPKNLGTPNLVRLASGRLEAHNCVMALSVERVGVLAGVLVVFSISYGKVSTFEVDVWSCRSSAGVAAGACVKLYRFVRSRKRTRTGMREREEMLCGNKHDVYTKTIFLSH